MVQNDWCIRHENSYCQILKDNKPLPRPKDKILVRIHLDGRTQLFYRDKPLVFRSLSPKQLHHQRNREASAPKAQAKAAPKSKKPSAGHPWRHGCAHMRNEAGK